MKIHTLRKMPYEDTLVYVMQFAYVFQYLFVWNKEIFMGHIVATPSFLKRLMWRLGRIESPYTKDELDQFEKIMLSGAMSSIDALKKMDTEKVPSDPGLIDEGCDACAVAKLTDARETSFYVDASGKEHKHAINMVNTASVQKHIPSEA